MHAATVSLLLTMHGVGVPVDHVHFQAWRLMLPRLGIHAPLDERVFALTMSGHANEKVFAGLAAHTPWPPIPRGLPYAVCMTLYVCMCVQMWRRG